MIAAILPDKAWFNWFDVALVLALACGFWRGRKNGLSKEIIPFLRWVGIILVAGLCHALLGDLLIHSSVIKSVFGQTFADKATAYVTSYLLIALVVWIVFIYVGRWLKPKLEHSSVFGSGEYYLGVVAGTVRYACMVLFALALLHAPYYTPEEIAARAAYVNRWYGGGLKDFKGDYIPSLSEIQHYVFSESRLGEPIDKHLDVLLINTRPELAAAAPVVDIQQ